MNEVIQAIGDKIVWISGVVLAIVALFKIPPVIRAKIEEKQQEHWDPILDSKLKTMQNAITKEINDRQDEVLGALGETNTALEETNARIDVLQENNVSILRHNIVQTYEDYKSTKQIPLTEWETVQALFTSYKKQHGNGFVQSLMDEMSTWDKIG